MCEVIVESHPAGFFSYCSLRLYHILLFFNAHGRLPNCVDSSRQFLSYKTEVGQDLTPLFFKIKEHINIPYISPVHYHLLDQFTSYKNLNINDLVPFIEKYFNPSDIVQDYISKTTQNYSLNTDKLAAIIYRGNDKCTETKIAPYSEFINKAHSLKEKDKDITFIVQTDEREFLKEFCSIFPDTIFLNELPLINKNTQSVVHDHIPLEQRPYFGVKVFGIFNILSKCKYIITHSGNCGIWTVLMRGNSENIFQYLDPLEQTTATQHLWI